MNDGGSHEDGMKKSEEYIKLLESSDQNDPRTVFYLAQTLRGMGRLAEAKEKYKEAKNKEKNRSKNGKCHIKMLLMIFLLTFNLIKPTSRRRVGERETTREKC